MAANMTKIKHKFGAKQSHVNVVESVNRAPLGTQRCYNILFKIMYVYVESKY